MNDRISVGSLARLRERAGVRGFLVPTRIASKTLTQPSPASGRGLEHREAQA
jgi:hypothetical protein